MRASTHITKVSGIDLHWEECGAGPCVVLLHGLTDWHRTWAPVASRIAERGFRVIALDMPGHGFSGRPDVSYTLSWNARIVGAWVDAVGIDRFSAVGHSYGGGVAAMLSITHAARIDHLALVAPGGFGREVNLPIRVASVPYFLSMVGLGRIAKLTAPIGGRNNEDLEERAAVNSRPGSARAVSRTLRDVIRWRGQVRYFLDHAYEAPFVPPMTLFWGEHDKVLPVAQAARVADDLSGTRLVRFEASGHYPHHDEPERFTNELERALRERAPKVTLPARDYSSAASASRTRPGAGKRSFANA